MAMKIGSAGLALVSCLAAAGAAYAWQTTTAAPNYNQIIATAQPGATIVLPSTFTGPLVITGRHFSKPITIKASATTLPSIVIRDSSNIIVEGGTVIGGPNVMYAVHIDRAKAVTVRGMTLTNAVRAIVIYRSESIGIYQNKMTGLRSDGVNIAESRKVVVEGNSCSNFNPIKPIYDAAGVLIKDGDHPDCIQSWSRPTSPPNSDILIRGNTMTGAMQGIFLGNHIRNGVNDGGFDRVVIENNFVNVSFPNGILIADARGLRAVNNEILTIPGSMLKNGAGPRVKAALKSVRNFSVVACGNIVQAVPTGFGTAPCRAGDAPSAGAPNTGAASGYVAPAPVAATPVTTTQIAPPPATSAPTDLALVVSAPVAPAPISATGATQPVLAVVQAILQPARSTTDSSTVTRRTGARGGITSVD